MKSPSIPSRVSAIALLCLAAACGRTDIYGTVPRTVAVSPPVATIGTGQVFQFQAIAAPAEHGDQFTWTVVSPTGPNGGTISDTGLYTAPTTMPEGGATNYPVVVQATVANTSLSRLTFSAEAHVTVVPVPIPSGITLVKVSGDNQMATVGQALAEPLVVKAVNASGVGVGGLIISFDSPLGVTGSASVPTQLDGTATATVSAGPVAGPQSFIVSTPNVQAIAFSAQVSAGPLTSMFASDDTISGLVGTMLPGTMSLVFSDQYGNPLEGHSAVAVPVAGGAATATTMQSDSTGTQLWQIQLGPNPGAQQFNFTDSMDSSISVTFTFTATPRIPTTLTLIGGSGQACTVDGPAPSPIQIQVTDMTGAGVIGVPVTWTTPDGGSFTQQTVITDTNGNAQANVLCGPKAGQQRFIVDAGDIANSPLQVLVSASAGPAASLVLVGGQNQTTAAGAAFGTAFSVMTVDAESNPVNNVTVGFGVVSGNGSISPTIAITGSTASGIAQANMVAGAMGGPQEYTAVATGLMGSPITLTLNATPPVPLEITVISGSGQTGMVGTALGQPLVVEVSRAGAPIPGVTVTFGVSMGNGTVGTTTVVSGMTGQASTTATLGTLAGTDVFSASINSANPVFFTETAAGQVIAGLEIISGGGQSAAENTQLPLPLVVEAIDSTGAPVPNAPISFTPPNGSGASVQTPTTKTGTSGQASTIATLGSVSGDELFVAASGNFTVTFRETALQVIEVLSIVSGSGQMANDGAALPQPLVVKVTTSTGTDGGTPVPLAGIPVTWAAQATEATISSGTAPVITNAEGEASVTAVLGQPIGQQTFTASVAGATGSPVTFTETATAAPASVLTIVSGNNQDGLLGSTLQPLVVKVTDSLGNPVANETVTFTLGTGNPEVDGGTGGTLSATTVMTQTDGVAQVTATLGQAAGTYTFIATAGTLMGSPATFTETATAAAVTGLSINPPTANLNVGGSVTFTAIATFANMTTQTVTDSANWSSSSAAVATVGNTTGSQGVAIAVSGGMVTITATYASFTATATITVMAMTTLTSIAISPDSGSLGVGTTLQFTAEGTFSNGTTSDITQTAVWAISTTGAATVNNTTGSKGLVSGVAAGMAVLTVTLDGVTANAPVTVIQSNVNNLQITPQDVSAPMGTSQQLAATATYNNGTVQVVTTQVTWSSSGANVTVSSTGLVQLVSAGTAIITASLNGVTATDTITVTNGTLESITVTPGNQTISVGDVFQFAAQGTYSNGSVVTLTDSVVWSASPGSVASVSSAPGSQGLATALGAGTAQIIASLSGVQGSASLMVNTATPFLFEIFQYGAGGRPMMPNDLSCIAGQTLQLQAGEVEMGGGGPLGFGLEDNTEDASWTAAPTSVGTVGQGPSQGGVVQCLTAGTVTVTATYKGNTNSVQVTVTAPTLVSIQILPATVTLSPGGNQVLQAIGTYSDGTTETLTTFVTWLSSNQSVASVSNAQGEQGTVLAVAAGMTTITASYEGVTSTLTVTVSGATLQSIVLFPANDTIRQGGGGGGGRGGVTFAAVAYYSDMSESTITADCDWTSSEPTVATIENGGTTPGRVTVANTGTTTISCEYDNMTGSTSLTVF